MGMVKTFNGKDVHHYKCVSEDKTDDQGYKQVVVS